MFERDATNDQRFIRHKRVASKNIPINKKSIECDRCFISHNLINIRNSFLSICGMTGVDGRDG